MKRRIISMMMACVMLAAVMVPASAAQADNSSAGCLSSSNIGEVLSAYDVGKIISGAKDFFDSAVDSVKALIGKNLPIIGDADGDGQVTILDATFIQRVLAGLNECPVIKTLLDVDRDGEITILDATMIRRWLAGLISPVRPDDPTEEPAEEPSDVDFASMKKLGEVFAVNSDGSRASNDQVISYIFSYNGRLYRAKAANTADITGRVDALDYMAEDWEEQYLAVIGDADLIRIDDITASIPSQEDMDALIGKTGQELLDMGYEINNSDVSVEGVRCSMEKGNAAYVITCDGTIGNIEGADAEALFKTMKVTRVEYAGESMAAYDLPESE